MNKEEQDSLIYDNNKLAEFIHFLGVPYEDMTDKIVEGCTEDWEEVIRKYT